MGIVSQARLLSLHFVLDNVGWAKNWRGTVSKVCPATAARRWAKLQQHVGRTDMIPTPRATTKPRACALRLKGMFLIEKRVGRGNRRKSRGSCSLSCSFPPANPPSVTSINLGKSIVRFSTTDLALFSQHHGSTAWPDTSASRYIITIHRRTIFRPTPRPPNRLLPAKKS